MNCLRRFLQGTAKIPGTPGALLVVIEACEIRGQKNGNAVVAEVCVQILVQVVTRPGRELIDDEEEARRSSCSPRINRFACTEGGELDDVLDWLFVLSRGAMTPHLGARAPYFVRQSVGH